jgi:DNA topoisomerase-1
MQAELEDAPSGLVWASDSAPGFRRVRRGRGFAYFDGDGKPLSEEALDRIRSLVIPPAWTDVWISPESCGHIQATGRDARGRKQYLYHQAWREHRDAGKFGQLFDFGNALPKIRKTVQADLRRHSLSRTRVTAAAVRLLDQAAVRVGNDQYARENGTFGVTTLRTRHAKVSGSHVHLRFKGKGGKLHVVDFVDPRLARVIGLCGELPGQELFQYENGDGAGRIRSDDINAYLREATGGPFTAKDFRTWTASVLAAELLAQEPAPTSKAEAKRTINSAARAAALRLGNTMTVCKQSYIHPAVFEAYEDGTVQAAWTRHGARWSRGRRPAGESLLLFLLRGRR